VSEKDTEGETKMEASCPHYRMITVGPLDGFHVTAKCENCGEEVQIERAAWIAGGIQHAMGKLR